MYNHSIERYIIFSGIHQWPWNIHLYIFIYVFFGGDKTGKYKRESKDSIFLAYFMKKHKKPRKFPFFLYFVVFTIPYIIQPRVCSSLFFCCCLATIAKLGWSCCCFWPNKYAHPEKEEELFFPCVFSGVCFENCMPLPTTTTTPTTFTFTLL